MKHYTFFTILFLTMLGACSNRHYASPASPAVDTVTPRVHVSPEKQHTKVLEKLQADDVLLVELKEIHPFRAVYNEEAIIPPMCYTRTEGKHNPCYVCHQDEIPGRENTMNDGDLQETYSFSHLGTTNHWKNLFEDRTKKVNAISDEAILAWVNQDNYSGLAQRLEKANFKGWIPDLKNLHLANKAFDNEGFALDGSGWVAFNYKPMPSTFWPTNGSTDDVMIRLPKAYQTDKKGNYSRDVYRANLALLEANIKGFKKISVNNVNENIIGKDLNQDGQLTHIDTITDTSRFVGGAAQHYFVPSTYPLDTEFLHSVRYLGVDKNGEIYIPKRMKELRYMKKQFILSRHKIYDAYLQESYAKEQGKLPAYIDRGFKGLDNEMGWVISGFLENKEGHLRFNTYEENLFCMGCHTSIGATIDKTFSFPRKVDGAEGWGYVNLKGMPDAPNMGESLGEIATYLERAGGGGEFRSNPEMLQRWFSKGKVDHAKLANAKDVYEMITPSPQRALELNKAYRVIVAEQDFIYGRDATVSPPINVYDQVDNVKAPTLPNQLVYKWDIRLDWDAAH